MPTSAPPSGRILPLVALSHPSRFVPVSSGARSCPTVRAVCDGTRGTPVPPLGCDAGPARGARPPFETTAAPQKTLHGGGLPADAGFHLRTASRTAHHGHPPSLSFRSPHFHHQSHDCQTHFFRHENQHVDHRHPSFSPHRFRRRRASYAPCRRLALLPSAGSTQLRLRSAHQFRAAFLRPPSAPCQPGLLL